jgi:hypothetical protein
VRDLAQIARTKGKNMKLDGREFEGVAQQITAAQNDYLTGHLRLAGVTELFMELGADTPEEKLQPIREQFITRILLSGRKSAIIAGCLTEVGKKWTRAEADRNCEAFDAITDPAEQLLMVSSLAGMVAGFFQSAGKSSTSSPNSSSPSDAVLPTKSAAPETSATSAS